MVKKRRRKNPKKRARRDNPPPRTLYDHGYGGRSDGAGRESPSSDGDDARGARCILEDSSSSSEDSSVEGTPPSSRRGRKRIPGDGGGVFDGRGIHRRR